MSNVKTVILEDGDDLFVMVRTHDATAFDPMGIYGSVMRMYRVLGLKSSKPVLELTPIMDAGLASTRDTERKEEDCA